MSDLCSYLADGEAVNWNKSCRPFGNNVGFTIAESAQYFILMDDKLALESGADILASAAGVFINADGNKKSISSPGAGNYITVAKSAALLQAIAGDKTLKHESFVQLHGTGTPQNRVTESHIFSTVAQAFAIDNWQATAVKNYLGHSIGTAAGDQLMSTLGVWRDGIIPGITNTKELATDVTSKNLNILLKHQHIDKDTMKAALINSKGFGGNNATAVVLSPNHTKNMLQKIHGSKAISLWQKKRQKIQDKQEQHKNDCLNRNFKPIYDFGNKVIDAANQIAYMGFLH